MHVVTQLQGSHRGEPACPPPRVGLSPALGGLAPEGVVQLAHAVQRHGLHVGDPGPAHRMNARQPPGFGGSQMMNRVSGVRLTASRGLCGAWKALERERAAARLGSRGCAPRSRGLRSRPAGSRAQLGEQQVAEAGDSHTPVAPGEPRLAAENWDVATSTAPHLEADGCGQTGAVMKDLTSAVGVGGHSSLSGVC